MQTTLTFSVSNQVAEILTIIDPDNSTPSAFTHALSEQQSAALRRLQIKQTFSNEHYAGFVIYGAAQDTSIFMDQLFVFNRNQEEHNNYMTTHCVIVPENQQSQEVQLYILDRLDYRGFDEQSLQRQDVLTDIAIDFRVQIFDTVSEAYRQATGDDTFRGALARNHTYREIEGMSDDFRSDWVFDMGDDYVDSPLDIAIVEQIEQNLAIPNQFQSDECAICMEQFNDPRITNCGHTFCHECILQSALTRPTCPLCRTSLIPSE